MNENGERFAGPCSLDQPVIGRNIFPRKQFYNDPLTMSQKIRSTIFASTFRAWEDVRVIRGATFLQTTIF